MRGSMPWLYECRESTGAGGGRLEFSSTLGIWDVEFEMLDLGCWIWDVGFGVLENTLKWDIRLIYAVAHFSFRLRLLLF